ncbi:MAG: matrixin family metalloprotease [Phycisphaerales bacterium]
MTNIFHAMPIFLSTIALSLNPSATLAGESNQPFPIGIAHPDELFMQELASRMFLSLPEDQQEKIAAGNGIGSQGFTPRQTRTPSPETLAHASATELLESMLSPELEASLTPEQITLARHIASLADEGKELPAMCFAPGTSSQFAYMIDTILDYHFVSDDSNRYQQGNRWSNTATNGGGLGQGDPTIITYSFAPDGAFIPDAGLGSGTSQTFAWLNGLYGSPAVWQQLFTQIFDRWEELVGVTYVYEPNDDGVNMSSLSGQIGVRGDVRIFSFNYPLDGNFGVLAYNFFPNNGDMAFDAFDTFYNDTSNSSRRFRNVAAHEHGHGLGMPHVCPANATKLMEPFVSTAYDGPQLDDILNGLRNYGDKLEPNDSISQATDLGTIQSGDSTSMDNLGVDDNSDDDFFKITVTQQSQFTFTVNPDADSYLEGPQTSGCDGGTIKDYNAIQDLRITVQDADGNQLAQVDDTGFGESETLVFNSLTGGDFYFVVDPASNVNDVQRYNFSVSVVGTGFINPVINTDIPDGINPGFDTTFAVTILPQSDILIPGTEQLFVSVNNAPFQSFDLVPVSGNDYTATIPAALCHDEISVYLAAEGETAGVVTFPANGQSQPQTVAVNDFTTLFSDNFETDLGWTVSGPVSGTFSGQWERGVPAGFGDRGDPITDADFSGSAFLTGNAPGNTDVDGGQTILTSPTFDMSTTPEAKISYSRWYDNTGAGTGTAPGEDIFVVQISNNNGSSWTTLETVGPSTPESSGGWFNVEHRVADFVTPTSTVKIRFIAEDIGDGSVVEAAVDAVLTGEQCPPPKDPCVADFTNDGIVDFFDVSAFLTGFNTQDPISDLTNDGIWDFFDISTFLQAFAEGCP